jgi:hypothetical protein
MFADVCCRPVFTLGDDGSVTAVAFNSDDRAPLGPFRRYEGKRQVVANLLRFPVDVLPEVDISGETKHRHAHIVF